MPDFLQRESNKITIANFYESNLLKKFNFEPPYQRRSLWSDEKKSFLIDSILRNFPIPPIFLHQKINDDTGMTTYDVIDGKQRLGAILDFIKNEIPVTNEGTDESDGISGLFFKDFNTESLTKYKSRFWRYIIPIEYIDTGEPDVIDSIFDRLNRNGEPLRGQELRNANFYNTPFLNLIEQFSGIPFWLERLNIVDKSRMEDLEFLSELAFLLLVDKELDANQSQLDDLYKIYHEMDSNSVHQLKVDFDKTSNYMIQLNIDYGARKVAGVSHLYGFFSFCHRCIKEGKDPGLMSQKINEFLDLWQAKQYENDVVKKYKESMSSRTKSVSQRLRRTESLVTFCF